jgi:Flp pilus assembly protein TadG
MPHPYRTRRFGAIQRCRGIATVEFALVAPFLLLLMLGMGEFGRMLYQYNTLSKSVREGARYLAGRAPSVLNVMVMTDKLRTETTNMVVYGDPNGGGDPLVSGLTAGDVGIEVIDSINLRVTATYQYSPATLQALPGFSYGQDIPLGLTLRASTTMRIL